MFDPTDQQLVLRTIRDVAGEDGLKALMAEKGGTEIWVSLDPGRDHWMSRLFGYEKAQDICRRLTVINADGRRVCNLRCYVSLGKSRHDEFNELVAREISDALLAGLSVRDVVAKVRVSERRVRRQKAVLLDIGLLRVAGAPVQAEAEAQPLPVVVSGDDQAEPHKREVCWEAKAAIVDAGLLEGHSNRRIAADAQVGRSYIRMRRKMLVASGRLRLGRINLAEVA